MNGVYGGILVRDLDPQRPARHDLGSGPYAYRFHRTAPGEVLHVDDLSSFAVYLLAGEGATWDDDGGRSPLNAGDVLLGEGTPATLRCAGATDVLVAGMSGRPNRDGGLVVAHREDLHRVTKPWGHELWINGEHPLFTLKEVFLTAGSRTSLQYHEVKIETHLLVRGSARFFFKAHENVSNSDVTGADLGVIEIAPFTVIDDPPPTLHRLEAITDITVYEASTPHLDDVVRVQDDASRGSGRIASEHAAP